MGTAAAQGDETEAASGGDEWLSFHGGPEHTGKSQNAGPPEEIELRWRWRPNYDSSPISASPVITSDGTLGIATEGGYVAVIKPDNGPSWIDNLPTGVAAAPAFDTSGNILVITKDGYAHYYNSSGELQWKCEFNVDIASSPAISGGIAYVGTDDNSLLAFKLSPDTPFIIPDSKKYLQNDVIEWSYVVKGSVKNSPAFAGNAVFFAGGDTLYALNPNAESSDNSSSMLKWSYDIHSTVHSSPAVRGETVYVGADDGYLYAFDENATAPAGQGTVIGKDGSLKWRKKLGGSISSSPAIDEREDGTIIYVGSNDGNLYAVDENGEFEWQYTTFGPIKSSPAIDSNGDIYFGSDDGSIYALYDDGSLKWKYYTGGKVRSSPAIGPNQLLYVGSDSGYLYCIGEDTRESREQEFNIDISLSLKSIENEGNPTTISAAISSDTEGQNILSRISQVTIDLGNLRLFGCKSEIGNFGDNRTADCDEQSTITREVMFDDGYWEDDVALDGTFTYAFGLTADAEQIGVDEGIFTHLISDSPAGIGPVPIIVTVTDLYGNQVSKPASINFVQKITSGDVASDGSISIKNSLDRQTLNISFTSGEASILSVVPNSGSPGDRVSVAIVGQNTNFKKNRTRVEIYNDSGRVIAYARPENDDVDVLSDTTLNAVLNILNTDQVPDDESITGRWDVRVTTGSEVVVGYDLFEISGTSGRILPAAATRRQNARIGSRQENCEFTIDITNEIGARPKDAPWKIATGYAREMTIDDARSGTWDFSITVGNCDEDVQQMVAYKLITTGSNFGYLTGEVRNAFTGEGIDNATITALNGDGSGTAASSTVSSGGGYYLLPLSAAETNYTVVAAKGGLIDMERRITVKDGEELQQNFSLMPEISCPVKATGSRLGLFYRLRDRLLQTSDGARWVAQYYRFARQVSTIIAAEPSARSACKAFLRTATKSLPLFFSGKPVPDRLHSQLARALSAICMHADAQLVAAVEREKELINNYMLKMPVD